ncbi:MAG: hypothetical protein JRN06_03250 [Nitrososphaerota archaeon]|nr:hypothetical protein [Nitrososphaerota archaeon]MDG7023125.1 hypothetical protein [Nitrososphaerota archaeon]
MSSGEEQILGAILYAAQSPDYTLRSVVFTDRQVFQVPLSKLSEIAARAGGVPTAVAWLFEAANPAVFSGLGGMVGMKMWKDLKKRVADRQVLQLKSGPLPAELLAAAKSKMAYDEVKDVKVKKVMMSSDLMLDIGAGFMHSEKIFFEGRAGDEVRNLIRATPLASKLKE